METDKLNKILKLCDVVSFSEQNNTKLMKTVLIASKLI